MQCLSHIAAVNFKTVVTAVVRHKFINHNNLYTAKSQQSKFEHSNRFEQFSSFEQMFNAMAHIFFMSNPLCVRCVIVLLYVVILWRNILENTTIR